MIELSSLAAGDGSHGFVLNGLDNFDDSGHAVSGIGDVNGDGIDDFVIGAPYADRNEDDREGESYVVFGGSGIGSGGSLDLGGLDGDNGFRIIGDDRFDGSGRSVSGAGDVNGDGVDDLIIGAPYADPNGTGLGFGEEGESYVIFGKLSTESFAATIDLADITAGDGSDGFVLNGVQEGDQSGYAVSSAGDVNGDGFADLLIGAWEANRGFEGSDRGEAYVVFGSDDKDGREMIGAGGSIELSDLDGSDGFKITGLNEFDYVGFSVSSAGDINGDDFDDILIGAPGEDRDANPNGFTYVLFGGEGGSFAASIDLATLDGSDGFRFAGREERDYAGTSVSGAGDVNGDGFNDLIIGAPEADPIVGNEVGNEGETFIIFGGPNVGGAGRPFMDTNLFDGSTGFTIDGIVEGDQSGYSVSGAGDVNGDGFTDLLIGAHRADPNGSQSGESYIVFGGSGLSVLDAADGATDGNIDLSNLDGTNGFVLNGIVAGDQSGRSVSGAGDVNGDGFDDFIIGAPRADEPNDAGESYVVFGGDSLSDLDGNADGVIELSSLAAGDGSDGFVIEGVVFSDRSGSAVSSAGDLNGDGFNDLIIGAPYAYGPPYSYSRPGESYVVFGGDDFAASLDLSEIRGGYGNDGFVLNGGDQSDRSGYAVGSAGDVNGDGFADFIIGAPKADPNGESEAGESYVVFGNHLSDLDAADGDTDGAIDLSSLADGGGTHGFVLNGISGLSEGDQSGRAVSGAGDVNGDGFADLIIGAPYVSETDEDRQQGEAYVVFGGAGVGTGGTIELDDIAEGDGSGGFVIEGVTEGYSEFGSSVSGAGDVNGDGFDDFLVGRPGDSSYAGYSATYVVFGGEDVGAGGSLDITTFTEADGFLVVNDFQDYDYTGKAVSGAGDVNGDGFDDLLVGARRAGPAGGAGFNAEGESYVIFGGDFSGAVTHQGGTGADSLSGTGAGDVMVGGLGDDVLVGGGEDVLRGGTGDDILGVGDLGFARIAGGAGEDVLRLDGAGLSLDLTAAGKGFEGNMKITGVEAIDLGGSGNALTLDLQDVLDMSDTSNTLKILGDEGDSLTADTETWTEQPAGAEGSEPGFTLYTNGLASLLIDDDVTQNVLSVGP